LNRLVAPNPSGGHTSTPAVFRYLLMVSRRTCVASWMQRGDQPSLPKASICCTFVVVQDIRRDAKGYSAFRSCQCPGRLCTCAGFQVTLHGRLWVITEDLRLGHTVALKFLPAMRVSAPVTSGPCALRIAMFWSRKKGSLFDFPGLAASSYFSGGQTGYW
jgi:hypothetical protein